MGKRPMPDMTDLHRSLGELNTEYDSREASPTDHGTLEMIVVRPRDDKRETPQSVELTSDGGVDGDHWAGGKYRDFADTQVTLMNSTVLDVVSGDRNRWALAGDNLVVDLDLSLSNLPAGQRPSIGSTVLEITETPHEGCAKFARRFGAEGLRFVNLGRGRDLRFRGVYARVVEAGSVSVGDVIQKV